ncbi:1,4-dihydroxy-6-naphtoate synthase [Clostridiales bacterium]|nr:1,4-dihydroxy-6-naphtoate synthase [Clostridiales bacterium]
MKNPMKILIAALTVTITVAACVPSAENNEQLNITMLKGPTGIGAVKLMEESSYNITIANAADEITGKILSGEADIAAVPTNLAAVIYNKTDGKISVLAVNTLGVLYVLENGESIGSVSDLSAKTIYMAGQGGVPEYVFKYILDKNGISDVQFVYTSEHAETASALLSGEAKVVVLPEPNVTAVTMKNTDINVALDLNEEWAKVSDSQMAMGCIIVRNKVLESNRETVNEFLDEYEDSINYVMDNVLEASKLVEKYGIMQSAESAEKAIPKSNICYIEGEEMRTILENFYGVLFDAEPKSVGGAMPPSEFYYEK